MKWPRILLIKTHAIGDVLLITPAVRALRQRFPEAYLAFLVGRWSGDIIRTNPYLDEVITFEDKIFFQKNWPEIIKLVRLVRNRHFDRAYIFHQSPLIHTLAFLFGIPERVGFTQGWGRYFLTRGLLPNAPFNRYVTRVFLDLVTSIPEEGTDPLPELYLTRQSEDFASAFFQKHDLVGKEVVAVFAGGGKNPAESVRAKCLSLKIFAEIIDNLSLYNRLGVVLIGGPSDRERIGRLKKIVKSPCLDLCGQTNLLETAALINQASLLITNDSAPLHMAVALSTPSISFFGPTSSRALVPDDQIHVTIQSPLNCSPCYNFGRFPGCPDSRCLDEITSKNIVDRALQLLYQRASLGN